MRMQMCCEINRPKLDEGGCSGPSSLGSLNALEFLDLPSNKLDGNIPWQLVNLNFLQVLYLS